MDSQSNIANIYSEKNIDGMKRNGYKYYSLICMIYLTLDLLSYLYVYYILNVEHLILSFSAIFFTATYIITDIVVEVYGYSFARRLIWCGLICEAIFTLFILLVGAIHIHSLHDNNINVILSNNILRIFVASLITTPVGDFVNSYVISRWKIHLKGKYFGIRSICATALGLIVYCVLSHTLLFINVLHLKQLITLILTTLIFKLTFVCVCSLPAGLFMRIIKKSEGLDHYDFDVNYNPFKFE